jgi:pyruvate dehydrogenase E2 component (dihydrolipoamide acetyltransferase)
MGALVAGELVRAQAARIRSLTLIAPAGLGEYINREFVDRFVTASSRREIRGVLEMLFADPAFVTRELVEDVLRYKRTAGVSEALATVRDCLFRDGTQQESIVELISDLDVPVTLIWGAEDRVLPATQRVAAPASSRIELLAGIGHSPHVEAAAEVNRILTEVLA